VHEEIFYVFFSIVSPKSKVIMHPFTHPQPTAFSVSEELFHISLHIWKSFPDNVSITYVWCVIGYFCHVMQFLFYSFVVVTFLSKIRGVTNFSMATATFFNKRPHMSTCTVTEQWRKWSFILQMNGWYLGTATSDFFLQNYILL